jgi:hypothetical protein
MLAEIWIFLAGVTGSAPGTNDAPEQQDRSCPLHLKNQKCYAVQSFSEPCQITFGPLLANQTGKLDETSL